MTDAGPGTGFVAGLLRRAEGRSTSPRPKITPFFAPEPAAAPDIAEAAAPAPPARMERTEAPAPPAPVDEPARAPAPVDEPGVEFRLMPAPRSQETPRPAPQPKAPGSAERGTSPDSVEVASMPPAPVAVQTASRTSEGTPPPIEAPAEPARRAPPPPPAPQRAETGDIAKAIASLIGEPAGPVAPALSADAPRRQGPQPTPAPDQPAPPRRDAAPVTIHIAEVVVAPDPATATAKSPAWEPPLTLEAYRASRSRTSS